MKRSLVVFVALGLLAGLVGCGDSSDEIAELRAEVDALEEKVSNLYEVPKSFTDLKGPLPESLQEFQNELLDGGDPTQVPLVQRNFLEGCMSVGAPAFISREDLALACGCSYTEIIKFLKANATEEKSAFDMFKDLDKASKEIDNVLGQEYKNIFEVCLES